MYSAKTFERQTLAVIVYLVGVIWLPPAVKNSSCVPVMRHLLKFSTLFILVFCGSLVFGQGSPGDSKAISEALQARDYDKAIALSRSALQQSPGSPQLWTLQGIAYASKGENKQALVAFQHALKISPNNIASLAGAAQIQYQAGSQDAVPLLNHLLQLRPGDPTASAMLAVLEYRQGNCKAAVP